MAKKEEKVTVENKLINRISDFVELNRKLIIICLTAVVVLLLSILIVSSSINNSREKAYVRVAELEEKLDSIIDGGTTEDIDSFVSSLEKEMKGNSYKSIKASLVLGTYFFNTYDYAKAYDYFMAAYGKNEKSYTAVTSLYDAAACCDELKDTDKALELYSQITEMEDSILVSKALFNVARINLQKGNIDLAKATFEQLIDMYPGSEYSSIANNIISLM